MKKILILLFSICMLTASAQSDNGHHQFGGNSGNGQGNGGNVIDDGTDDGDIIDGDTGSMPGDPDYDDPTQVPLDDYVPFLIAGVGIYCVGINRQKKMVQA